MDLSIGEHEPLGALPAEHIEVVGSSPASASAFDVDGLLVDTARYAMAASDSLGATRNLVTAPRTLDRQHLLAYCTTHLKVNGETVPAWAELSGVYPTADDRRLQIHCNFAHHRDGVVSLLGCKPDTESVAAAIAKRNAFELETELIANAMIGAEVRTLDEWAAHPHHLATSSLPLMSIEQIGDASPRANEPTDGDCLTGVRVLDCSRVLAGPVAGQLLANRGADVLRLGAEHLPSIPVGVMTTGFGKRNASLDLRVPGAGPYMESLLTGSDIWLDAYRPGAFESLGFSPSKAAELRPGIVIIQISAFDWIGPWAGRRGYDSIVQSTTGLRWAGGRFAGKPEPIGLPVQALDYATGFLAAGLGAQLLEHQRRAGGSWLGRLSLLRTRNHLVTRAEPRRYQPGPVEVAPHFVHHVDSEFGRLSTVRPFAGEAGKPPTSLGSSAPAWL